MREYRARKQKQLQDDHQIAMPKKTQKRQWSEYMQKYHTQSITEMPHILNQTECTPQQYYAQTCSSTGTPNTYKDYESHMM